MRKLLLLLWMSVSVCEMVYAQQAADVTRVYYRLGYRTLDTLYRDNYRALQRLVHLIGDSWRLREIDSLEVWSYASPDGSMMMNRRLTQLRSDSLVAYLVRRTGLPETLFRKRPDGVGWGLLRNMVAESDMPYREEVLEMIDCTPECICNEHGRMVDGLKKRLMNLRGGEPYLYMSKHFFPDLRSASAVMLYLKEGRETQEQGVGKECDIKSDAPSPTGQYIAVSDTSGQTIPDAGTIDKPVGTNEMSVGQETVAGIAETEPLHRLAVKTNLLYDVLLMPSLEVEYRIDDRWSVNLEGDMAWLKRKSIHKYYQLAMISPEIRYWFKTREPWHGHYIGAFVGGGWYDLENGKRGYQGEGVMTGLSYGYMWPVTRCLSFEAGVGIGYLHTKYEEYLPESGGHYLYQQTSKTNYIGPLKLKFALVWRMWDLNKKKGGMQ